MKLQVKILVVLLLVAGISTASMATDPKKKSDVAIKILPSGQVGLVKLLYFNPGQKKVDVTFYDDNGVLFTETVRSHRFKNGFIKLYDIKHLKPGSYWVEVTDAEMSVKYELALSKDTMWVNYWNNFLPENQAVALKK